jgi:hypothetical protein
VLEERCNGYGSGQQDEGGTGEAAPAGWIPRSQRRDQGHPERFEEGTKEGHANPLYQYPTAKDRASKKTAPQIRAIDRDTPHEQNRSMLGSSLFFRQTHEDGLTI